jgi:hypothetical protein
VQAATQCLAYHRPRLLPVPRSGWSRTRTCAVALRRLGPNREMPCRILFWTAKIPGLKKWAWQSSKKRADVGHGHGLGVLYNLNPSLGRVLIRAIPRALSVARRRADSGFRSPWRRRRRRRQKFRPTRKFFKNGSSIPLKRTQPAELLFFGPNPNLDGWYRGLPESTRSDPRQGLKKLPDSRALPAGLNPVSIINH